MINKKMIIVIAIFIATGFLVFSFAATPQGETVDNNGGSTTNNTNDKNNNDNKNSTNNSKDKDKDNKKDNDIIGTPIGSLDNQNNSQNTILDNNGNTGTIGGGNQWASGNTGTTPGGNTGENQTGGNTGTTTPGENTGENKPSEPSNPDNPTKPDEPNKPDEPTVNVDELTGPSVFVSTDEEIDVTVGDNNVITYEGVVEKSNVDDFGVYYVNVIVRAPYKYSQDVLKNASVVTPYGEKYNAGFLQYDSEGYAYFSIPQGFINGVSSELSLTVNWGVGENIVYTLKSNINVVD